jgi:hypothetical protein
VSVGPVAVPAAGADIGIGFAIVAGLVVGIGVERVYIHTLGALLQAIASAGKFGVWKIKINVGGPAEKLNNRIKRELGNWILANEQALGLWWHANKQVAEWTYDGIVSFGHAVHSTIAGVVYGEIPAQVHASTRPLSTRAGRIDAAGRARDRAEAKARSRGIAAEHDYVTGRAKVAERGIDDVRSTIRTNVIPRIRANERALARERAYTHRGLSRRLSRLEKWLAAGVIGGVAIAALTRVFPYWQCSNVRRFLRGVCRSPLGALDWLFALAALVVVALDPAAMARAGEELVDLFEGVFRTMAGVPAP